MFKSKIFVFMSVFAGIILTSCANIIYYGYLPGSEYSYYEPFHLRDLKRLKINLRVIDNRTNNFRISCSSIQLDRYSELEGRNGFDYFKNYCRAMIEFNNGIIDTSSTDTLTIKLNGFSSKLYGFVYIRIYGLVEFSANGLGIENRTFCSEMMDGDNDAPLQWYSFDTRKGAFRKIVSGSTRRVLEELIHAIEIKSNLPNSPE